MPTSDVREYRIEARSTDTFGRVLCAARQQHFVVDGPVQNGCPGEAVTPAEIFLAGVAALGVLDRSRPVREDVNVFNAVHLTFTLEGVAQESADELVAAFKRR